MEDVAAAAPAADYQVDRSGHQRHRQHQRHLSASGRVQRRGRDRHGRGDALGGQALVRHLSAARAQRQRGQTLDGGHQPHAHRASRERGLHGREPSHPSRVAATQHRPLPHRLERHRARDLPGDHAGAAHRFGAPSHRPDEQDLHRDDGGGALRGGRQHPRRDAALRGHQQRRPGRARRRICPASMAKDCIPRRAGWCIPTTASAARLSVVGRHQLDGDRIQQVHRGHRPGRRLWERCLATTGFGRWAGTRAR